MSEARRLRVTLYARPGCHLCEEAVEILAEISRSVPLEVETIDIESDDTLLKRYLIEIPVIAVGGQVIAQAPIRARALEAALRSLPR